MAQYLSPFPGARKTSTLLQREEELRNALRHGASAHKVAKCAERIRAAKQHLIKAQRFVLAEKQLTGVTDKPRLASLQREETLWKSMTTDEIIDVYRE
jgi:hypothetical protein